MKECDKILGLLPLYIDSSLSEEDAANVREHLAKCSSCREEERFLSAMMKEMSELPEIEPSEKYLNSLHEKLVACKKTNVYIKRRRIFEYSGILASAAVIAICLVAYNNAPLDRYSEKNISSSEIIAVEPGFEENKDIDAAKDAVVKNEENIHAPQKARNISDEVAGGEIKNDSAASQTDIIAEETEKAAEKAQEAVAESSSAPSDAEVAMPAMTAFVQDESGGAESGNTAEERAANFGIRLMSFYKNIFVISSPVDEEIKAKIEEFPCESGEYKMPADKFFELTELISGREDIKSSFKPVDLTEEYDKLAMSAESLEGEELKIVRLKMQEIEEMSNYGFIIIE